MKAIFYNLYGQEGDQSIAQYYLRNKKPVTEDEENEWYLEADAEGEIEGFHLEDEEYLTHEEDMDILGEDEYFDDEDLALESNNGPYYDENGFEINEYGDRIDEDGNVLDEEDLEGELYQEDGIPCLPDEQ